MSADRDPNARKPPVATDGDTDPPTPDDTWPPEDDRTIPDTPAPDTERG